MIRLCKILPVPLVSLLVLCASVTFAREPMVQVSDNIYSYLDVQEALPNDSFGANSGIIIGDDGVAVVDALGSAKEAQRFLAEIKAITDKPIRYLILTHHHLDHSFGAAVFKEEGAEIIAHTQSTEEMTAQSATTLKNAASYGLTEEDLAGTTIVYPTMTFDGEIMELDLKGRKVNLISVSPSHSRGSLIVHIVDERVIFAGDLVFTDYYPYMGESHIGGWRSALDKVASLSAEKIIPGHGPLSFNRDLGEMKNYIIQFDTLATEIKAHGKDIDFAYNELLTTLPKRTRAQSLIMASLQMKYFAPQEKPPEQKKKIDNPPTP